MNRTGIEYLDYTWNPYTGCLNWKNGVCGGGGKDFKCWAKGLVEGRLKRFYPYGFEPTYHPSRILEPCYIKQASRIGVSFMGDLFGDWIQGEISKIHKPWDSIFEVSGEEMVKAILEVVQRCPQHKFVFLTKCPWNLPKWNPWPDNCWVGATATNHLKALDAQVFLTSVDAKVKFMSYEPMLDDMNGGYLDKIQLVILGGKSGKNPFYPPEDWIWEIEQEADRVGAKVFEKDNLRPGKDWTPRREWPK